MIVYANKSNKIWYLLGVVVLIGEKGVHWKPLVAEKTKCYRN